MSSDPSIKAPVKVVPLVERGEVPSRPLSRQPDKPAPIPRDDGSRSTYADQGNPKAPKGNRGLSGGLFALLGSMREEIIGSENLDGPAPQHGIDGVDEGRLTENFDPEYCLVQLADRETHG